MCIRDSINAEYGVKPQAPLFPRPPPLPPRPLPPEMEIKKYLFFQQLDMTDDEPDPWGVASDEKDCKKCQSIFWNLIELMQGKYSEDSVSIIREIAETKRCDKFSDLSDVRMSIKGKIGAEGLRRIMNFNETEDDEKRARQSLIHYYYWINKNMKSSLSIPNQLYYYSFYKIEVTLAALGLIAGGGLYEFVKRIPYQG
eukprot:TRINITY_DN7461_c0_g2_i1.p1 TRINITY_DN7461_c0_g2~~TRINITY_DN7461_c0_g2_i1.p1  ORF type:complete len:198 (-),score=22.51 TRINITY_DN7461_c0_g2_i1:261-854(-)